MPKRWRPCYGPIAFNKHDREALADLWSPQGVYVDRETGARFTGRDAIIADLKTVFEERPEVQLDASLTEVRFVKPDVAVVEGQASSSVPGEEAGRMSFSAILVKQGDQWLVDSVEESAIAAPETPYDALKDLEWMVGHWVDETDDAAVDTVVRWSKNRSFLIRSFNITLGDEDSHEGTQVIGWDPVEKRIRSWIFDSDGSFGEGAWFRNGDTWMSRVTVTLADGRLASGTQVFTPAGEGRYTVETIGREIGGEPSPSAGPINVVRADETADAAGAETNPPAGE
jgi:uncharacterized protein (TIGR02246 family)